MTKKALIWLAILIAAPSSAFAQQRIPSIEPGQRVRINGSIEASYLAASGDSLIARIGRNSVKTSSFPLASIRRLEVLTQRRATKKGAVIGGLVLGIPSAIVWGALADWCFTCESSFDSGDAMVGFFFGGAVGAGIGALIGAPFKSDRWEDVPVESVRLSLMPQLDGRLALGVEFKF